LAWRSYASWIPARRAARIDPLEALPNAIQALSPQNDMQRSLKAQAVQLANDLGQMRWLLYEQVESSISMPLLVVVISWLTIVFVSVGLFAPPNSTVIVALMLAALSVSGAIFLILDDRKH
jgi:beta-lactamase superfamily II metal-dependent hydrolase